MAIFSQIVKRWKNRGYVEWKVVLGLLVGLGLAEIGFRRFETAISKDLTHIHELPDAAMRIRESAGKHSLLVVGNSLARNGMDQQLLNEAYPVVEFFYPDGSTISEWCWGVSRYFLDTRAIPEQIWIVTGNGHLEDSQVAPEKLGAYWVGPEDVRHAIQSLEDDESKFRFALGRVSRLFANRGRIRPFVGYRYLPGFEAAWPSLVVETSLNPTEPIEASRKPGPVLSLERFLDAAEEMNCRIKVIKIPLPESYHLSEQVKQTLQEREIEVIDLTEIEGVDQDSFPDGYHLGEEGRKITTVELLKRQR